MSDQIKQIDTDADTNTENVDFTETTITINDGTAMPVTSADLTTLKKLGSPGGFLYQRGYTFIRPLGTGGNSIVGLYQKADDQSVAIKVVEVGKRAREYVETFGLTFEEAKKRFYKFLNKEAMINKIINQEARAKCGAVANLILNYKTVESPDGEYFFFISPAISQDLEQFLTNLHNQNQNQNQNQKALLDAVVCQLIYAVACLHKMGIVHGDLKPSNIFIEKETGTIKIGDFGESAYVNINQSLPLAVGQITGITQAFAPPEILKEFKTPTTKFDIWSLGLIILILTGRSTSSTSSTSNAQKNNSKQVRIDKLKNLNQRALDNQIDMAVDPKTDKAINTLLKSFLQIDPNKRVEIDELLKTFPIFTKCRTTVDKHIQRSPFMLILEALESAAELPAKGIRHIRNRLE